MDRARVWGGVNSTPRLKNLNRVNRETSHIPTTVDQSSSKRAQRKTSCGSLRAPRPASLWARGRAGAPRLRTAKTPQTERVSTHFILLRLSAHTHEDSPAAYGIPPKQNKLKIPQGRSQRPSGLPFFLHKSATADARAAAALGTGRLVGAASRASSCAREPSYFTNPPLQ